MRAAIEVITATKSSNKIIARIGWRDRLKPASRCLEEHLDVSPPEAREAIFVLDDDDADLGVAQQFVQFETIVVNARCDLRNFRRDLVALGGGIMAETLHLA